MTSRFAEDDAANPEGQEGQAEQQQPAAEEVDNKAAEALARAAIEQSGDARWHEPAVAAQRILTEVWRSGGKSALELEDLLNRNSVDPQGFIDYWARAQFLREVVKGRERRFELSKRAVLELELDVA